jgi:hypothetical protein
MNALDRYVKKTGEPVSTLAIRLGRHPATLLRPLNGTRNATMQVALDVQRGTKGAVTALDFVEICMEAAERRREAERRRQAAKGSKKRLNKRRQR